MFQTKIFPKGQKISPSVLAVLTGFRESVLEVFEVLEVQEVLDVLEDVVPHNVWLPTWLVLNSSLCEAGAGLDPRDYNMSNYNTLNKI